MNMLKEIRQQLGHARNPSAGQLYTPYEGDHWSPAKKYTVFGGGLLLVIMAAVFVLALKIALILTGVILAAVALFVAYRYLHKKLDRFDP